MLAPSSRLALMFALLFVSLFVSVAAHSESASPNDVGKSTVGSEANRKVYPIPRSEIRQETIEVLGRPLHFVEVYKDREQKPKPLIIFVHGTPGSWYAQRAFLSDESLRDAFHMIAVDRLGHGESVGDVVPSLAAQAASLKPLLDRDTTGRGAILVGHSLGGPIIARTAMDYPEKIAGLVFVASTGDPAISRKWYNLVAGIPPIRWFLSRELLRANKEILPIKKELTAMLPLWSRIEVPTTIIQGDKDKLVNPKNADFIERALVNAPVTKIVVPEGNHAVYWSHRQLLIDVLAGFQE